MSVDEYCPICMGLWYLKDCSTSQVMILILSISAKTGLNAFDKAMLFKRPITSQLLPGNGFFSHNALCPNSKMDHKVGGGMKCLYRGNEGTANIACVCLADWSCEAHEWLFYWRNSCIFPLSVYFPKSKVCSGTTLIRSLHITISPCAVTRSTQINAKFVPTVLMKLLYFCCSVTKCLSVYDSAWCAPAIRWKVFQSVVIGTRCPARVCDPHILRISHRERDRKVRK